MSVVVTIELVTGSLFVTSVDTGDPEQAVMEVCERLESDRDLVHGEWVGREWVGSRLETVAARLHVGNVAAVSAPIDREAPTS